MKYMQSLPSPSKLYARLYLAFHRTNPDISDGETPLHYAAIVGNVKIIKCLIKLGANINQCDINGYTALHNASCMGNAAAIKILVALGADIHARNIKGATPLRLAILNQNDEIIKLLVRLGANIREVGRNGFTCLHRSVLHHNLVELKLFASLGADLNAPDLSGSTPLHYAVSQGRGKLLGALIELGANINLTDIDGNTPLHIAIYKINDVTTNDLSTNDLSTIKLLLDAGADINIRNKAGNLKTSLELAIAQTTDNILKELLIRRPCYLDKYIELETSKLIRWQFHLGGYIKWETRSVNLDRIEGIQPQLKLWALELFSIVNKKPDGSTYNLGEQNFSTILQFLWGRSPYCDNLIHEIVEDLNPKLSMRL